MLARFWKQIFPPQAVQSLDPPHPFPACSAFIMSFLAMKVAVSCCPHTILSNFSPNSSPMCNFILMLKPKMHNSAPPLLKMIIAESCSPIPHPKQRDHHKTLLAKAQGLLGICTEDGAGAHRSSFVFGDFGFRTVYSWHVEVTLSLCSRDLIRQFLLSDCILICCRADSRPSNNPLQLWTLKQIYLNDRSTAIAKFTGSLHRQCHHTAIS